MEELQEADVLWPETPPPSRGAHLPVLVLLLQLQGAAPVPSRESFAAGAPGGSTPRPTTTSTATLFGRRRSDDASTAAWFDDDDDVQAEEFQEADVLWPDDAGGEDTARDHQLVDVGEFWWLSRDSGEAGSHRMIRRRWPPPANACSRLRSISLPETKAPRQCWCICVVVDAGSLH